MAHNLRFSWLPLDCRVQLALQFSFRLRLCMGHLNIQCGPIHEICFHLSFTRIKTLKELFNIYSISPDRYHSQSHS